MFVKIDYEDCKNRRSVNAVLNCFLHEYHGTKNKLEEDILYNIDALFNPKNENNKELLWLLIRDYPPYNCDYDFDYYYNKTKKELLSDVLDYFVEVQLTDGEYDKFVTILDNYVTYDLAKQIMGCFEKKYPNIIIKTGDISPKDETVINDCVNKIVNILENVAIENMTNKED